MTALEQIEFHIQKIHELAFSPERKTEILGPLYVARAIERLEATVRTIGVNLQGCISDNGTLLNTWDNSRERHP